MSKGEDLYRLNGRISIIKEWYRIGILTAEERDIRLLKAINDAREILGYPPLDKLSDEASR